MERGAGHPDREIESAVDWLQGVGLAGPAYLVIQGFRPLSFVGGQGLLFLQPLLPLGKWRSVAGHLAGILEDRSRVDTLLAVLSERLYGPHGTRSKEDA